MSSHDEDPGATIDPGIDLTSVVRELASLQDKEESGKSVEESVPEERTGFVMPWDDIDLLDKLPVRKNWSASGGYIDPLAALRPSEIDLMSIPAVLYPKRDISIANLDANRLKKVVMRNYSMYDEVAVVPKIVRAVDLNDSYNNNNYVDADVEDELITSNEYDQGSVFRSSDHSYLYDTGEETNQEDDRSMIESVGLDILQDLSFKETKSINNSDENTSRLAELLADIVFQTRSDEEADSVPP